MLKLNPIYKKTLVLASIVVLLAACSEKTEKIESNKPNLTMDASKKPATHNQVIILKPECTLPVGEAMGESGELTTCYYNTDSISKVYDAIIQDNVLIEGDSGYKLLKKKMPTVALEEHFKEDEVTINYKWLAKDKLSITIQMAGGEDNLILVKERNKVRLETTLSAD